MGPVTLRVGDLDRSIEIYRDRPRSQWRWSNGRVQMAVDPLNLREILAEGDRDPRPRSGLPAGTTMGHVHQPVYDTGQAADFYSACWASTSPRKCRAPCSPAPAVTTTTWA